MPDLGQYTCEQAQPRRQQSTEDQQNESKATSQKREETAAQIARPGREKGRAWRRDRVHLNGIIELTHDPEMMSQLLEKRAALRLTGDFFDIHDSWARQISRTRYHFAVSWSVFSSKLIFTS